MKILNKENREIVTTVVAVAAIAISLISLTMGELRYRRSMRPDFSIALEQEYNGPISILESDGNGYFEGFVKLTIYNHGEKPINISSIDASMKNKAIVTDNTPVLPAVHGDGEPVRLEDVSFSAIGETIFNDRATSTSPTEYLNEISLPIAVEAHNSEDLYIKIRSLIMESPHVVSELKKITDENKNITAGQLLTDAIKKGYGRLVTIRVGDKTVKATSGPDRTITEIRVKSVEGILGRCQASCRLNLQKLS